MEKLIVYLDDERKMPKGYDYQARTAEEVIGLIKKDRVEMVSLDNDLGIGYTQGKKVAQWIEENYLMDRISFVDFHPHTSNPVAFDEIMACKRNVIKHKNKKNE
ncbi:MAG: cyclic-phosphate processing receiver domain-containing protein [Candidatus Paceibacteria bacterium]